MAKDSPAPKNLAHFLNTTSEYEKKAGIHTTIGNRDTKTLEHIIMMGANIFYFDTIPRLLFFPLFLLKVPFIYSGAKPEQYAKNIPAIDWTPRRENCGLIFPNSLKTIRRIPEIPDRNLRMSDYNHLDEHHFLAALFLLLTKNGTSAPELSDGIKLIESIVLKPKECPFLDYFIDAFSISSSFLDKDPSLANKIFTVWDYCDTYQIPSALFALMVSFPPEEPHMPASAKPSGPIPPSIIACIAARIGDIQHYVQLNYRYLNSYDISPVLIDNPANIIQKLIDNIRRMQANFTEKHHHTSAILNIVEMTGRFKKSALIAMIALLHPKAGQSLYELYRKCLNIIEEEKASIEGRAPKPVVLTDYTTKSLMSIIPSVPEKIKAANEIRKAKKAASETRAAQKK